MRMSFMMMMTIMMMTYQIKNFELEKRISNIVITDKREESNVNVIKFDKNAKDRNIYLSIFSKKDEFQVYLIQMIMIKIKKIML